MSVRPVRGGGGMQRHKGGREKEARAHQVNKVQTGLLGPDFTQTGRFQQPLQRSEYSGSGPTFHFTSSLIQHQNSTFISFC